eukprot:426639-Pleurochrysis_carterae.AAC.1
MPPNTLLPGTATTCVRVHSNIFTSKWQCPFKAACFHLRIRITRALHICAPAIHASAQSGSSLSIKHLFSCDGAPTTMHQR